MINTFRLGANFQLIRLTVTFRQYHSKRLGAMPRRSSLTS